jgi:Eco57I restriction-modification methylase
MKRVVYGVDKNPMAVELAKVALWLHSFTVGAPLSFLDHHLRCGDSVLGAWVRPTIDALKARGALFNTGPIASVERVASLMAQIEETTDNDIAEVTESKAKFGAVEDVTEPVAAFFSLLTAEKLMGIFDAAPKRAPLDAQKMEGKSQAQMKRWHAEFAAFEAASAFQLALEGTFGDPVRIAAGETKVAPPDLALQIALLPEDQNEVEPQLFPHIAVDDRRRVLADRLVDEAHGRAVRHRFFNWEIAFPNVWANLLSATPRGGFDAVIGNPPYVRQELLGDEIKRGLKSGYAAYDGMADLYVYFYEQALRLLRPGGRLGYVVTNKWLRAGYAEALRELFATSARIEFVADFGHAKHFFPDADVFPSVVVVRKPEFGENAPTETQVCVIPRDAVPERGLSAAVAAASYPLPLACFTKESWTLEPPEVMALLDKIRRNGVPLAEYVGAEPFNGIKTGLNEAFLINRASRDELMRDDPACAEIIKPYLRGQDIERWQTPEAGLFMVLLKSSADHPWPWAASTDESQAERRFLATYPSLHARMKKFETFVDQKTGKTRGLRHREDQGRFWWELRPCAYYDRFSKRRLVYQAIQFYPRYSIETEERFGNNKTYLLPTSDATVAALLNSPAGWFFAWRHFLHMKDEALSNDQIKIVDFPIPTTTDHQKDKAEHAVALILKRKHQIDAGITAIRDWLHHEFGVSISGRAFERPQSLDGDGFVAAARAALPKARKWSAGEIARLKQEYTDTLMPAREAAVDMLALERKLSDLVNLAYDLTPEEVALMWRTAPPRMPLDPQEELRRLGAPGATAEEALFGAR